MEKGHSLQGTKTAAPRYHPHCQKSHPLQFLTSHTTCKLPFGGKPMFPYVTVGSRHSLLAHPDTFRSFQLVAPKRTSTRPAQACSQS